MARTTLAEFSTAVSAALGARLVTLLLYGSAARRSDGSESSGMNTLLVVAGGDGAADATLFERLADPVRVWIAAGHPPPLILTEREWRESADAFPIEYEDIRDAHRVLAGRDPWSGITVQRDHVRRQLEHELKGKLVHLRQAYAAQWGQPKRLAELVADTRPGFLTMLRATLRLAGRVPPTDAEDLVRAAAALIGFAADGLAEPAAYLAAVARTAEYVNRMERNAP
jgi:hypothetical protein